MSRYLIVTWDGAGNQVPTLGIARALVELGHDVRLLGHRSIDERFGSHGWSFVPMSSAPEYDAVHPGDLTQEMSFLVEHVFFSAGVASDTFAEIEQTPTDVVLVDALMLSGLCAAEASRVPTAVLFHTAYCLFRGGPLLEMVSQALPMLAAVRADLGLDPIAGIPELHDRCRLGLVASPRAFEPPGDVGAEVRFVGPILNAPQPLVTDVVPPIGDDRNPLVIVSFSTSDMGQTAVVQRVLDALASIEARVLVTSGPSVDPLALRAPANAKVLGHVPHAAVLPAASVVVTHAGMGTVMAALAHGVPLVSMPMGRDQFFNAQRVSDLDAGRLLDSNADAALIADTVSEVLANPRLGEGAKQMAKDIATCGGAYGAVSELERVASEATQGGAPVRP